MPDVILRRNATPVYAFLSFVHSTDPPSGASILDCGAGGPLPPLALFHQHGFDAWGIDKSDQQLERARSFCRDTGLDLHLSPGDMRCLDFRDETFDYVYEHYSMCHLTRQDTARAIAEMRRVLKPGGLCFLGMISADSGPKAMFGEQRAPGEYWMQEHGDSWETHSLFTDEECDRLVANWTVLHKEKRITYLREQAANTSLDEWVEMHAGEQGNGTPSEWKALYEQRMTLFRYAHIYYVLEKG